jgi:hypothetical protein
MKTHAVLFVSILLGHGCKEDRPPPDQHDKAWFCDRAKEDVRSLIGEPLDRVSGARRFILLAVEYCARVTPANLDTIGVLLVEGDPKKIDAELTRLYESIEYSNPR